MVFKAGEAANPTGHNGRKVFIDALNCMISQKADKADALELPPDSTVAHLMAQKLVKGALRDDWKPGEALAYLQEICDRAYGKPKQAITGGDEDDKPLFPSKIEIELVKPNAPADS